MLKKPSTTNSNQKKKYQPTDWKHIHHLMALGYDDPINDANHHYLFQIVKQCFKNYGLYLPSSDFLQIVPSRHVDAEIIGDHDDSNMAHGKGVVSFYITTAALNQLTEPQLESLVNTEISSALNPDSCILMNGNRQILWKNTYHRARLQKGVDRLAHLEKLMQVDYIHLHGLQNKFQTNINTQKNYIYNLDYNKQAHLNYRYLQIYNDLKMRHLEEEKQQIHQQMINQVLKKMSSQSIQKALSPNAIKLDLHKLLNTISNILKTILNVLTLPLVDLKELIDAYLVSSKRRLVKVGSNLKKMVGLISKSLGVIVRGFAIAYHYLEIGKKAVEKFLLHPFTTVKKWHQKRAPYLKIKRAKAKRLRVIAIRQKFAKLNYGLKSKMNSFVSFNHRAIKSFSKHIQHFNHHVANTSKQGIKAVKTSKINRMAIHIFKTASEKVHRLIQKTHVHYVQHIHRQRQWQTLHQISSAHNNVKKIELKQEKEQQAKEKERQLKMEAISRARQKREQKNQARAHRHYEIAHSKPVQLKNNLVNKFHNFNQTLSIKLRKRHLEHQEKLQLRAKQEAHQKYVAKQHQIRQSRVTKEVELKEARWQKHLDKERQQKKLQRQNHGWRKQLQILKQKHQENVHKKEQARKQYLAQRRQIAQKNELKEARWQEHVDEERHQKRLQKQQHGWRKRVHALEQKHQANVIRNKQEKKQRLQIQKQRLVRQKRVTERIKKRESYWKAHVNKERQQKKLQRRQAFKNHLNQLKNDYQHKIQQRRKRKQSKQRAKNPTYRLKKIQNEEQQLKQKNKQVESPAQQKHNHKHKQNQKYNYNKHV